MSKYFYNLVRRFIICTLLIFIGDNYAQSGEYLDYSEVKTEIKQISQKDETYVYNISFVSESIKLTIFFDEDSSIIEINKQKIFDSFNFYYNASLETSLKKIRVLKSNKNQDFILLLPSISDEFPTFELIKFEKRTNTLYNSVFSIETYQNICNNLKFKIRDKGTNFIIEIEKFKIRGTYNKIKS
ncbi:hypothetical protein [Capnocytophaga cynodegmi]|uniref:hypothetical protein n=1 Tax=Capnocytophaga cynodegmi TaxID=28189 RepID=UPI0012FFBE7F|nr:hypothetical protein [Capnocytophaga cynodegmi]